MKLCECGCGKPAPIAKRNKKSVGWVKGEPIRFIHGHNNVGKNHPNWNNGQTKDSDGRVFIKDPNHKRANKANGYVKRAFLVAEKALGKSLPPKTIIHHHKNVENDREIVICENQAYHMLLHQRKRAYNACGNANYNKCPYCKQYDDPNNMILRDESHFCHKECRSNYQQAYKIKNEKQLSIAGMS